MFGEDFKTIDEIKKAFPNEQSCIELLEKIRWNGLVISPFDPKSRVYCCKQNRYRCSNTGKYFNVKTSTVFYNSKIELQKWFIAIWLVSSENKIITSVELSKELKITQKSAWLMIKHIQNYFELEEKYVSKKQKNHKNKRINEIEVVIEKDKLQLIEWLKLLKK
jgi:16S rRNA C1402 (ribose-2'-O) methylase RsmI